jgi:hypothetical protein
MRRTQGFPPHLSGSNVIRPSESALEFVATTEPYRSSSAAITLMLPSTATTSLTMCPSMSLGNTE